MIVANCQQGAEIHYDRHQQKDQRGRGWHQANAASLARFKDIMANEADWLPLARLPLIIAAGRRTRLHSGGDTAFFSIQPSVSTIANRELRATYCFIPSLDWIVPCPATKPGRTLTIQNR